MNISENFNAIKNIEVAEKFNSYPNSIQQKLMFLRQLIIDTSAAREDVTDFQETLKWGEPSYLSKQGVQSDSVGKHQNQINTQYFFTAKRNWLIRLENAMANNSNLRAIEPLYFRQMTVFLSKR